MGQAEEDVREEEVFRREVVLRVKEVADAGEGAGGAAAVLRLDAG